MTEETVFATALEKETPAQRAAFLDEACAGDPALRRRVEALLESHSGADAFLDKPAVQCAAEEIKGRPCGEPTQGEPPSDTAGIALDFLGPSQKPGSLGRFGHYEVVEV